MPGARIGNILVEERIGAGGMGEVYRGTDLKLQRKVALKRILPESQLSAEARSRFLREARILSRLDHPAICRVYELLELEDGDVLVLELVEGETLRTLAPTLSRERVLEVCEQVALALEAAHRERIVHRDLKPENLMITPAGAVKVLDFGLARSTLPQPVPGPAPGGTRAPEATEDPAGAPAAVPGEGATRAFADLAELRAALSDGDSTGPFPAATRAGIVVGTLQYMSPEQALGRPLTEASDIYSLGVMLQELLTGRVYEAPDDPIAFLDHVARGALLPVTGLDPETTRLIEDLRRLDPADRPTAAEAARRIRAILDRPARTRRRRIRVAGAVAAGVLLVGAWALLRREPPAPCQGAAERLAGVWDDARRTELRAAFERTGVTGGRALFDRTARVLDRYAAAWASQRTEACEATHVRAEQSAELLDLRMACLDRRRDALGALVRMLAAGEPEVLSRSLDAALALEPLAVCGDTELLLSPVPRPGDAESLGRLRELEGRLATVRAAVDAGRVAATLEEAEALVEASTDLGFAPFEAECRLVLSDILERLARFDAAADEAFRSWAAAERGAHEEYRVRALTLLVWIDGEDRGRLIEAERWAELGEAALSRIRSAEVLKADLQNGLGAVLQKAGRGREALERHRLALELRTRVFGPESWEAAKSLNNIGSVLYSEARFEEALASYERALELLEPLLGVHPATALGQSNVGSALVELRRPGPARRANQRALEMRRELFGEGSLWVGISEVNLALTDLLDEPARALPRIERATRILRATLPPGHPILSYPAELRGRYLLETGRAPAAVEPLMQALELVERGEGREPYRTARLSFQLARAVRPANPGKADRLVEEARAALRALSTRDTPLEREIDAWLALPRPGQRPIAPV